MSEQDPKQTVAGLVERFGEHVESYKNGSYNETQLRREFLDPLLKALGWDVDNTQGYAEAYKDVIHATGLLCSTTDTLERQEK